MVECVDCGWSYVQGYAPNERFHRKKHDEVVNGSKTGTTGWLPLHNPFFADKTPTAGAGGGERGPSRNWIRHRFLLSHQEEA